MIGGPCTVGLGKVVDLPLKKNKLSLKIDIRLIFGLMGWINLVYYK